MLDQMRNNAQSWAIKALFDIIILAFIITFAAPRGQGRDSVARVYEDTIPV
ncbi:MAG: SurA N-terminal domain-containing protein, partial [Desulfovibrionaceae bacterium]